MTMTPTPMTNAVIRSNVVTGAVLPVPPGRSSTEPAMLVERPAGSVTW